MSRLGLAGVAATAIAVAGCGAPSNDSSSESGAAGSGVENVTFALPHKGVMTSSLPYAVAQAQGFFKKHGVAPKPVYTSGGGSTVQAVIGGNAQIAVETGPSAVMSAYQHGAKLKIVGSTMMGLDVLYFAKASSPYRSVDDLAGKKIGFSEPGSSSNVAAEQLSGKLQKKGLPAVKPEAIGSPPDELTAVQTGQIAAGFTAPPLFLDKAAAGKLRILVEPKDYPAYRDVVVRVAFAGTDYLDQHAKAVRGFLAAWQEAWDWSFAHKAEAAKIYKQAFAIDQDLASIEKSFDYYTPAMLRLAPINGMDRAAQDALHFKLIQKALSPDDLSKLVDTSYAPKASS